MKLVVENLPARAEDAGDMGLIPRLGRSLGGGHGNPIQYSWLENPHGRRCLAGYSPWGHTESDTAKHSTGGASGKEPTGKPPGKKPANEGDMGSISGLRRFPRGGHGNPPQYSCLENPMDRGAWRATVHGVAKSRTRLSN